MLLRLDSIFYNNKKKTCKNYIVDHTTLLAFDSKTMQWLRGHKLQDIWCDDSRSHSLDSFPRSFTLNAKEDPRSVVLIEANFGDDVETSVFLNVSSHSEWVLALIARKPSLLAGPIVAIVSIQWWKYPTTFGGTDE